MADEQEELPDEPEPKKKAAGDGKGTGKGAGKGAGPLNYASRPSPSGPGYFTIYKKGQGYWTRMGTVIGAVIIGVFMAYNLYAQLPPLLPNRLSHAATLKIGAIVAGVFVIGYVIFCWWMLNKPSNADFLIATDSEMKKVNWTSRRELVGSTKIVIAFMFLVAIFLFGVDQIFGWLMYVINVLKISPWGT